LLTALLPPTFPPPAATTQAAPASVELRRMLGPQIGQLKL
jgi:hypothetical protein